MPSRRRTRETQEDATGLAGWMFTDLLLGLTVVFMATVSFVPETAASKPASAYAYTNQYPQVFEHAYSGASPSAASLRTDIDSFLKANNLPSQAFVQAAQFIGGYTAVEETPAQAINRAVAFSAAIDKQDHELLAKASTTVDGKSAIESNTVVVRLKFAVLVR